MRYLSILFFIFFVTTVNAQTKDLAARFCILLSRENWSSAMSMMDGQGMKGDHSAMLRDMWAEVQQQYGQWEQLGEVQEAGKQGLYDLVRVYNEFQRSTVIINVAISPERKIVGFTFSKVLPKVGLRENETLDTVQTQDGSVLYGTLQQPAANDKVPMVLIIPGSGMVDRNGDAGAVEMAFQHSYLQLADGLNANGIASLRYDKRGVGRSTQISKPMAQTSLDDYISDAAAWVQHLRNSGNFSRIIIIGHSEGSLIGMAVASLQHYDAFISIAGPADPVADVVVAQINQMYSAEFAHTAKNILDQLKAGAEPNDVPTYLLSVLSPASYAYWRSSFRYLPCEQASHLNMPMLIINGTKDTQVLPAQAAHLHECQPNSALLLIKDMVHPLKDAAGIGVNQKEALPLHPALIPAVVSFIRQH
ncbi:alpha/beta fold hydrolase [Chitinophaga sp. Hz27]|uniref:alpha/beta fold hydrolase n=1 Tax=Chitinophaga sp. Hz27 TaxID=3347169 RepID=UPI0035DAE2A6